MCRIKCTAINFEVGYINIYSMYRGWLSYLVTVRRYRGWLMHRIVAVM